MIHGIVCFSHGKESGPWGTKISALAQLAQTAGWSVESLDYQGMDDPHARVQLLVDWCAQAREPFVLVGSSMGGHVATAAANLHQPLGLFLLAPAFYMPGYEELTPACPDCPITIVHGRRDDIVPVENSMRFAESGNAELVIVDSDHRLTDIPVELGRCFQNFLAELVEEKSDA